MGVCGPFGYKRQLSISEIVRAEEPNLGTGLYLRTSNRYCWILIAEYRQNTSYNINSLRGTSESIVKVHLLPLESNDRQRRTWGTY